MPGLLPAVLLLLLPVLSVHREMLLGEDSLPVATTQVESLRRVRTSTQPDSRLLGMADEGPASSYQPSIRRPRRHVQVRSIRNGRAVSSHPATSSARLACTPLTEESRPGCRETVEPAGVPQQSHKIPLCQPGNGASNQPTSAAASREPALVRVGFGEPGARVGTAKSAGRRRRESAARLRGARETTEHPNGGSARGFLLGVRGELHAGRNRGGGRNAGISPRYHRL